MKFYLPSLNFATRQHIYHVYGLCMYINIYARIQVSNTYRHQGQLYQRLNRVLPILFHTNQLQSSSEFCVLFSTHDISQFKFKLLFMYLPTYLIFNLYLRNNFKNLNLLYLIQEIKFELKLLH